MEQKMQGKELSVMEAVEKLSSMAELDEAQAVATTRKRQGEGSALWDDPERRETNEKVVKETFRVLRNYLQHVYHKDHGQLEDQETRQGIQAIMVLANEAAQKLDKFTVLFKGVHQEGGIRHLKEFQDLEEFYLTKIMKKFHQTLASEEAWQAEWGGEEVDLLDIQRRGLKDLETVRRDKEYELFYIRKEDGRPFFNRNLVRHIKLVGEFDESMSDPSGDDPFVRIKMVQDQEVQVAAQGILQGLASSMGQFFKEAMQYKDNPFVASLTRAIMALMLAANPRNLMQNTLGKSSVSYFIDFHMYLRESLASEEYRKFLDFSPEQAQRFTSIAANLAHQICKQFFTSTISHSSLLAWIEKILKKVAKEKGQPNGSKNPLWIWNRLFEEDEEIRSILKAYPNGPLMKTLDALREGEGKEGFDPLARDNPPHRLFEISGGDLDVMLIHLPSPTKQSHIHEAQIVSEFEGFLRALSHKERKQRLLLINLQDRTSWQESARCHVLENLQKGAEFSSHFIVVTLPKHTDFYLQTAEYEKLDNAQEFMGLLREQVESGEECGFYLPSICRGDWLGSFLTHTLHLIHEQFFALKEVLTRKNRLDFLEIFYHFFALKMMEIVKPDFVSFTCKDGVDTGAVASGGFYAFLKILGDHPQWKEEERAFLYCLFYAPSFLVRERAVDPSQLHRQVSALSLIQAEAEAHGLQLQRACCTALSQPLFKLFSLS